MSPDDVDVDATLAQLDRMRGLEQVRAHAIAYLTGVTSSLALSAGCPEDHDDPSWGSSDEAMEVADALLELMPDEDLRLFVKQLAIVASDFVLAHPEPMERLDAMYRLLAPTLPFWGEGEG